MQVVYAARTLAAHPESEAAQKNMAAFKQAWIDKVNLLTSSIDAVIPIQDFIAVTGMKKQCNKSQILCRSSHT